MKDQFFRRKCNDLIYFHTISLIDALKAEPVFLTTLDDRKLAISIDEIISPQTVKFVKGEGMPIYEDITQNSDNLLKPVKKGNLYIKFNVIFPKYIDPRKKDEIVALLEDQ